MNLIVTKYVWEFTRDLMLHNFNFRYQTQTMSNISEKIKSTWQPPNPAALHWDGKLMETLTDKYAKDDRLPTLISGVGGIKLLGVPALPYKSSQPAGNLISSATVGLLQSWNCEENVSAMVFDTTAANTGHLTAGCICIQEHLGRALLWCACRKHVGEIILTKVWDSLNIVVSRSKDITLFVRFRENFSKLPFSDPDKFSKADSDLEPFLYEQREIVVDLLQSLRSSPNSNDILIRSDYRELLDLVLLYLDCSIDNGNSLHKPGATHKARWMGKLLYTLKLVILKGAVAQEKLATISQLTKINRFVKFVVFVYIPWWFTCSNSTGAPSNDLLLYKNIMKFTPIDPTIGEAALKAMKNHLWYLVPDMIPLALFDDHLSANEKQKIVQEIIKQPKQTQHMGRYGTAYGKPTFPEVEVDMELCDFVSADSWQFFNLMKIDPSFLECDLSEWQNDERYLTGKKISSALKVTNDSAERGVKLAADYLKCAQKEDRFQNVLQVVENSRNICQNQRKRSKGSDPDKWYLVLN